MDDSYNMVVNRGKGLEVVNEAKYMVTKDCYMKFISEREIGEARKENLWDWIKSKTN